MSMSDAQTTVTTLPPALNPNRRSTGSCTDEEHYTQYAIQAATDDALFASFRSQFQENNYAGIEALAPGWGIEGMEFIRKRAPDVLLQLERFMETDTIGEPERQQYGDYLLSTVVVRYIKVASDLLQLFGRLDGMNIIEIGAGFGGQCKILSDLFRFASYTLIDLPEVLNLHHRFLGHFGVRNVYYLDPTREDWRASDHYDLIISNYVYTELSETDQNIYYRRVLKNSQRGYITDNSVWSHTVRPEGVRIRAVLPARLYEDGIKFYTAPDHPVSHPGNAVVFWGNENPYYVLPTAGWLYPHQKLSAI